MRQSKVFQIFPILAVFTLLCLPLKIFAQHSAANDAELSVKKLQPAPGLKVELFASEPLLKNPVAFSIDERGRFFIAETHRYKDSIFDITRETNWLMADLSFRKVEDRAAFLEKEFATNINFLTKDSELIRLVEDRDGDGRAETSLILAEGFNETVSGTAAGILARKGKVWFTCIPDLWKISIDDRTNNSKPKVEKLASGFGVHIGVSGHDLHGLAMGPDGKIYFSCGDRGFSVHTKEGKFLNNPDSGGVLRCNPDGSELEIFAAGLRNPQELAFDQYGNLFTDDNDTAGEDKSRFIYVVEGGDYGWRASYQFMDGYGPWVQENNWLGGIDGSLPYSGEVAQGPSGLAFYSGTGLPEKYQNHFLACDFPKGVWSFAVKSKGASYEVVEKEKFLWNLGATDVDFGPDGSVYVSDWGTSYSMPESGRIYRVFDPAQKTNANLTVDKKLTNEGQLVGYSKMQMTQLLPLIQDADSEVRAQAAMSLANHSSSDATKSLVKALGDSSLRVRFFAAMSLGKLKDKQSIASLLEMLKQNADQDAYLVHAGVFALVNIGDFDAIQSSAKNENVSIRRAALLTMRRMERPEISQFLNDANPKLVNEAARAINDAPINDAMPQLAALLNSSFTKVGTSEQTQILRRAVNANFRLGQYSNAVALATFAVNTNALEAMRAEAVNALSDWENPSPLDRVMGLWRPLPKREVGLAQNAFVSVSSELFKSDSEKVLLATVRCARKLKLNSSELFPLFKTSQSASVRVEILQALAEFKSDALPKAVELALGDSHSELRREGIKSVALLAPEQTPLLLERLLATETDLRINQTAFATLGKLTNASATEVLLRQLDLLLAGKIAAELQLDLLDAAEKHSDLHLSGKIAAFKTKLPKDDSLADFRVALVGGDAERGKKIFHEREDVACLRCHAIGGKGGNVGPDLGDLAKRQTREYFLESILEPNKQIASGFENIVVTLKNETAAAGLVKSEDKNELVLNSPEDGIVKIKKEEIEKREQGLSPMPEGLGKVLTKFELRDLIEFLAGLK